MPRGRSEFEPRSAHPPRLQESSTAPTLLGEADLHAVLTTSLQELAGELTQGKSERLQRYLEFGSRFHTYSRANQWLIFSQMPEATRVASYRKWQEEGYQVARGQHGIRILAPSIRKQTNPETGEDEAVVIRFVAVSVFDVSQLTPEKWPPQFFTPLDGNHDDLYARLVDAAIADGFIVSESSDTHGAEGYSQGRALVTRTGPASTNRALTLIHEYAHGLLHQGVHALTDNRTLSIALKECHAEATTYMVACHFGVPAPFSADYLLQWGATPDRLRAELDAVLKAASHIISRITPQLPPEELLHAPEAPPQPAHGESLPSNGTSRRTRRGDRAVSRRSGRSSST